MVQYLFLRLGNRWCNSVPTHLDWDNNVLLLFEFLCVFLMTQEKGIMGSLYVITRYSMILVGVKLKTKKVIDKNMIKSVYIWKLRHIHLFRKYYNDVIMSVMASQITSVTIVYSSVYPGGDQRKHQSSASLAFVGGNSPVTGEYPAQRASNAVNVSIWWRHHE